MKIDVKIIEAWRDALTDPDGYAKYAKLQFEAAHAEALRINAAIDADPDLRSVVSTWCFGRLPYADKLIGGQL